MARVAACSNALHFNSNAASLAPVVSLAGRSKRRADRIGDSRCRRRDFRSRRA
jgi:hypothetical protein